MNDLHDRLDNALSTIMPAAAPIDATIKHGKRIRWRRKATATAVVAAAVIAAAVTVPLTEHHQASPAPVTGNTQYTVTVQPPGPHAPDGEVAYGTLNRKHWDVRFQPCNSMGPGSVCILISVGLAGSQSEGGSARELVGNDGSVPVSFHSTGDITDGYQVQYGEVRRDVTSVTIRFGDGDVVPLHPVVVHGVRMVAFVAPLGTPMTATAYGRAGEIGTAIPLVLHGQAAMFVGWLRPGQAVPPVSGGLIGFGASAYIGPWGVCLVYADGNSCQPPTALLTTGFSSAQGNDTTHWVGTAAARVTRIEFAFPHGKKLTVKPVTVGGYKFVAFTTPSDTGSMAWVAYDARGNVVDRS